MSHLVPYKRIRKTQVIPEYVVFYKEVGFYLEGSLTCEELVGFYLEVSDCEELVGHLGINATNYFMY